MGSQQLSLNPLPTGGLTHTVSLATFIRRLVNMSIRSVIEFLEKVQEDSDLPKNWV